MKPISEQNMTQQNAIEIILFLIISMIAFYFGGFNLFLAASEPMKVFLGAPPEAYLVSISLVVYFSSALIIRIFSILNDVKPIMKWTHLGYRTAFFVFYCFSGSIAANFIPVFLVGIILYSLDQFHVSYYNIQHSHQGGYHESA